MFLINILENPIDSEIEEKKIIDGGNTLIEKDDYKKIEIDGTLFYLTHGHLINKYEELFNENYIISGHTHVYNLEGKNLNPGSVGIPKVNQEHTCLLYENKTFKLINLDNFDTIKETTIYEE